MRGIGRLRAAARIIVSGQEGSKFSHEAAQRYELRHGDQANLDHFPRLISEVTAERERGGLWQSCNDQWFGGNEVFWREFVAHVRERKCLEIGSGPFGYLSPCGWIKDRVIIDPLVDTYRDTQLKLTGKTFFSDDIKRYNKTAETVIQELVGKVDGAIICQNALDHCNDPLKILCNASQYAKSGCYLLLWTDIWHLSGLDDGHRNITQSTHAMDALLIGLGFDIVRNVDLLRDQSEFIEYGRLACKR